MNRYVVLLVGQGDTHISFVKKETWDWINDGSTGMSEAMRVRKVKNAREEFPSEDRRLSVYLAKWGKKWKSSVRSVSVS